MSDNYYELTKNNIRDLISESHFEEAMIIINDELSAPYIPKDFERALNRYKFEIEEILKKDSKTSSSNWSLEKVVDIMQQSLDQEMHLVAFDNLRNLNARKILDHIKDYLNDENIKNEYKTFLLMVLIEQKLDEFLLVKKKEGIITINPAKFDLKESQDFLRNLEYRLMTLVSDKDPSLFSICRHVANTYFYNIFPDFKLEQNNIDDIVACVYIYSRKALGIGEDIYLNDKLNFNYDNAMLLLSKFEKII
ncbi:hypothetical protein [Spiroplasma tabanidicola]|uniref:DUF3196 domain-containing protein n=1 Tax=Spiroplasma tabanidicola TaxID=324079 RepID=A0A6I6CC05_9MOLU|nr:hypothetical protein [Spiroplasma tabanidicola]QGS51768.1 hypothetical protein STABA_v1c04050 [Spiroplasma tabanidicola]